jgi:hypothetical protein
MSTPTWRSGPPPSLGWYQASVSQDPEALRWRGEGYWSVVCRKGMSARMLNRRARTPATTQGIQWLPRPASWPKRSRT